MHTHTKELLVNGFCSTIIYATCITLYDDLFLLYLSMHNVNFLCNISIITERLTTKLAVQGICAFYANTLHMSRSNVDKVLSR